MPETYDNEASGIVVHGPIIIFFQDFYGLNLKKEKFAWPFEILFINCKRK